MSVMDLFCSTCGTAHVDHEYPMKCPGCSAMTWGSPTGVVVVLQRVRVGIGRRGLLMARRAIEPHRGGWAFLGGHVNRGESFEQAACREWLEETGRTITADSLEYVQSYPVAGGAQTMAVFRNPWVLTAGHYERLRLCPENMEFGLLTEYEQVADLCFPTHREIAEQCFNDCWF